MLLKKIKFFKDYITKWNGSLNKALSGLVYVISSWPGYIIVLVNENVPLFIFES